MGVENVTYDICYMTNENQDFHSGSKESLIHWQ